MPKRLDAWRLDAQKLDAQKIVQKNQIQFDAQEIWCPGNLMPGDLMPGILDAWKLISFHFFIISPIRAYISFRRDTLSSLLEHFRVKIGIEIKILILAQIFKSLIDDYFSEFCALKFIHIFGILARKFKYYKGTLIHFSCFSEFSRENFK